MRHITLRILCEGQTEAGFVNQVLKPHLAARLVFAKPEPLCKGAYGVVPYDRLRNAIKAEVGRSKGHEYVTTMIDLYKLGRYPGVERASGETPIQRVTRIEQSMAEGLPNHRFLPYVQLHEFEALVLVDVTCIPEQFPDGEAAGAPARILESIGAADPEDVDEGELTTPSKRIIQFVPAYRPLKSLAGPAIAASIGVEALRARCPHFHHWLARLEQLSEDD